MAELVNAAKEIVTEMQKLQPGESVTLSIFRWLLTQGTVSVFVLRVIEKGGTNLNYDDFIFNYENDITLSGQDLVPITITRLIANNAAQR